jgi:hypothetical protein
MVMENFPITVSHEKEMHHFEVSEHPHPDGERCKYRVFEHGSFVASFQPDAQNYLHICQNAAGIDEELLYLLADQIEATIPPGDSKHFNDNAS